MPSRKISQTNTQPTANAIFHLCLLAASRNLFFSFISADSLAGINIAGEIRAKFSSAGRFPSSFSLLMNA